MSSSGISVRWKGYIWGGGGKGAGFGERCEWERVKETSGWWRKCSNLDFRFLRSRKREREEDEGTRKEIERDSKKAVIIYSRSDE